MLLLQFLIPTVPLASLPIALWIGFRKTMWCVLIIGALIFVTPHVYFGVWGLWEGVSLSSVFEAIHAIWGAFIVVLAYMVLWAVVYAGVGGVLRYGWMRWRAA